MRIHAFKGKNKKNKKCQIVLNDSYFLKMYIVSVRLAYNLRFGNESRIEPNAILLEGFGQVIIGSYSP